MALCNTSSIPTSSTKSSTIVTSITTLPQSTTTTPITTLAPTTPFDLREYLRRIRTETIAEGCKKILAEGTSLNFQQDVAKFLKKRENELILAEKQFVEWVNNKVSLIINHENNYKQREDKLKKKESELTHKEDNNSKKVGLFPQIVLPKFTVTTTSTKVYQLSDGKSGFNSVVKPSTSNKPRNVCDLDLDNIAPEDEKKTRRIVSFKRARDVKFEPGITGEPKKIKKDKEENAIDALTSLWSYSD